MNLFINFLSDENESNRFGFRRSVALNETLAVLRLKAAQHQKQRSLFQTLLLFAQTTRTEIGR